VARNAQFLRALRRFAGLFLIVSAITAAAFWFTTPAPTLSIHVRWTEGLADAQRAALERQFHLENGRLLEDTVWQYSLTDYSSPNIQALVEHPDVADTDQINRALFQPVNPPRSRAGPVARWSAIVGAIGSLVVLLVAWGRRRRSRLLLVVAGVAFVCSFAYVVDAEFQGDEEWHYAVVVHTFHPEVAFDPILLIHSVIPGYHVAIAVLAWPFNATGPIALRVISFMFTLLAIVLFYALALTIADDDMMPALRTATYAFFPIMFPFELLIYTEPLAFLLLMAGLLLLLKERYVWAGAAASLSLLVRQNNVIWLVFLWAIIWYDAYGHKRTVAAILTFVKGTWTFLAGAIFFAGFVIGNGGVSLGDVERQPSFTLNTGNIFLILFLTGILLLPVHVSNLARIRDALMSRKRWFLLFGLGAAAALYVLTFRNTHPYNTGQADYFLHNWVLIAGTSSALHRLLFFVPVAMALMSLMVTRLKRPSCYFLYLATALFLLPSWLIDPRYYYIPFALFLLFLDDEYRWPLWATLALSVPLSLLQLWGIKTGDFFS
jgi:alpha-1,2-glucosyltransferase